MKNKVSKPAKALFTIGAIIAIVSATISFKSCRVVMKIILQYLVRYMPDMIIPKRSINPEK